MGHDKIVELLINSEGIDINLKDNDGYTALDRGFIIKLIK
jgi:ankyrin repeat protein